MNGKPAVFLDRDGTVIDEVGYLDRPERVTLYPWTIAAIRAFNRVGMPVVLVTNQSGIARGFFSEEMLAEIHRHLEGLLASGDARIDRYYYCPHHPDGRIAKYATACDCRKPGRALVDRAERELGIDPRRSFVVGDRWLDIRLAQTIGARSVLVRTGYGAVEEQSLPDGLTVDAIVDNLIGAADWILRHNH